MGARAASEGRGESPRDKGRRWRPGGPYLGQFHSLSEFTRQSCNQIRRLLLLKNSGCSQHLKILVPVSQTFRSLLDHKEKYAVVAT